MQVKIKDGSMDGWLDVHMMNKPKVKRNSVYV